MDTVRGIRDETVALVAGASTACGRIARALLCRPVGVPPEAADER